MWGRQEHQTRGEGGCQPEVRQSEGGERASQGREKRESAQRKTTGGKGKEEVGSVNDRTGRVNSSGKDRFGSVQKVGNKYGPSSNGAAIEATGRQKKRLGSGERRGVEWGSIPHVAPGRSHRRKLNPKSRGRQSEGRGVKGSRWARVTGRMGKGGGTECHVKARRSDRESGKRGTKEYRKEKKREKAEEKRDRKPTGRGDGKQASRRTEKDGGGSESIGKGARKGETGGGHVGNRKKEQKRRKEVKPVKRDQQGGQTGRGGAKKDGWAREDESGARSRKPGGKSDAGRNRKKYCQNYRLGVQVAQ
ncbi:hypothetical protein HNY73_009549 [Argiope bruennichi]|uniref:Uncharacterized protein n=1 Tax=Argiope bruennichi TaxID=94029 RepID=A0A8T0FF12_ARGBR|nr:hypothetical protein HNY73_009549 [Argiope bruennichi]